jgi:hypothetical protein
MFLAKRSPPGYVVVDHIIDKCKVLHVPASLIESHAGEAHTLIPAGMNVLVVVQ